MCVFGLIKSSFSVKVKDQRGVDREREEKNTHTERENRSTLDQEKLTSIMGESSKPNSEYFAITRG